jgi:hypothetical protein
MQGETQLQMIKVDAMPIRFGRALRFLGFLIWLTAMFFPPLVLAQGKASSPSQSVSELHEAFAHPPEDSKIMMRWWWFGPSATKPELQGELEEMKAAGIGGVEIATLYPLALDDPATNFRNYDFVSEEHLENLRFAAKQARRLGLRVDITLGTGWPLGGPHIPVTQAAGELRIETQRLASGSESVALPALEHGEEMLAAFFAPGVNSNPDYKQARRAAISNDDRLQLPDSRQSDRFAIFFISSRTGMMVKRAAQGGGGFVLDHYDISAVQNHLRAVGDRLIAAFDDHSPYAVFSDSLEDYGSDWTPNFLTEFQHRRGYDLAPYLPALVGDIGPDTAGVRHDWGQTLTELANERFLQPLHTWAQQHHTLFRSQTYGFPPVTLASNQFEDLPEGEGKATIRMWREFSDTRWAASAGHLFHHPVISSETWTWLHSPPFRATPLDMKAEADLHFLQGINQLVGHGWPHSPEAAGEPGWRMYAAGAFDSHNPWFAVMPDLSAYLQRVSWALRQGSPANDVAVLLPNDDVWASFKARVQNHKPATSLCGFDETGSNVTIDESMSAFLGHEVISQILDAGFNLDFIDTDAINTVGIKYKVLVLPGVERIPVETYEKIAEFGRHGGIVVATRRLPGTAPGHLDANAVSGHIEALSDSLFHGKVLTAHFVPDERKLGASLATWLSPDFRNLPQTADVGFIHRHLEHGDLYFVANTSNQQRTTRATFRSAAVHGEEWDPFTGKTTGIGTNGPIELTLEPYQSRIFFFSSEQLSPVTSESACRYSSMDLSHDWRVTIGNSSFSMAQLSSWTERPDLRYFSGHATYEKIINIADHDLHSGKSFFLDFGQGIPVPLPDPLPRFNMRAYLNSPMAEAAQVFVNERFAGYVWHPPFRIEISSLLQPGNNRIRILVSNTAINELAGEAQPNYRLLYARYGVEFIPQGMENLEPVPSGMLGPVTLKLRPMKDRSRETCSLLQGR